MGRRRIVAGLLLAPAAPLAGEAQPAGKVYGIGVQDPTPVALNLANLDAFRQGMREFQYAEGQNFVIEYRSPEGLADRFAHLAIAGWRLSAHPGRLRDPGTAAGDFGDDLGADAARSRASEARRDPAGWVGTRNGELS